MLTNNVFRATITLLFLSVGLAQSTDPLIGTWQLNRGKSDFQPPSTLLSRMLTFQAQGNTVKVVQKTVTQQGSTVEIEYTASYDDKDVPISNSPLDTVALKRVNANLVERTGKIKGEVIEKASMAISPDKKILTITTKGSVNGNDYSNTQVFERQ